MVKTMIRPIRPVLATCGVLALVLTGCSSGGSSGSSAQPSSEAPSSAPSTEASSSASSTASSSASSSSSSAGASGLTSKLITSADVGSGFSGGPAQSQGDDPFPCTPKQPSLATQVPGKDRVFAAFKNEANTVAAAETIYSYSGESTSKKAFAVAKKGFSCSRGTLSSTAIKIMKRAPQQTKQGITLAAWDFTDGKSTKGTVIVLQKDDLLIALQFLAQGSAGANLDVGGVTDRAVARLS